MKTINRPNKEGALDYVQCLSLPPQMPSKEVLDPCAPKLSDGFKFRRGTLTFSSGENQSIDHLIIDDCPFELEMQSSHMTFSRPQSLLLLVLILYCTRLPCTLLRRAHEAGRDLPTYQTGGDIFRSETNQLAALVQSCAIVHENLSPCKTGS